MSKRPIASLTLSRKVDGSWVNYSILSVWATEHAGLYSISADKGSDKYPPIDAISALKAFVSGARMSIRVASESRPRTNEGNAFQRDQGGDDFGSGDPDIPF